MEKKYNPLMVAIIIMIIVILSTSNPSSDNKITKKMETKDEKKETIVYSPENKKASIKPVIVDRQGNILNDGLGDTGLFAILFSLVGKRIGTGYIQIDNTNSFLAFQTAMDNSLGDSVVIIDSISAFNLCNENNPFITLPGCVNIPEVFGSSGNLKGNLNQLWTSLFPLELAKGEISSMVQSNPIDISGVEVGLVDFNINIVGIYLDELGNPLPLQNTGGRVTLKISPERCNDGTPVDVNSANADEITYCSAVPGNVGKYCRVNAYGNALLTDRASLCGCELGFFADGEICRSASCGTTWAKGICNPSGGILYCNLDGTISNECELCDGNGNDNIFGTVDDKCPINANGDRAMSCIADTNSLCKYPTVTGSGFYVDISEPDINPIEECGDGVKDSSIGEECDTLDLGGQTCQGLGYDIGTLSCNMLGSTPGVDKCVYDVTDCLNTTKIKFRTSDTSYGSNSAIALLTTQNCGDTLNRYGMKGISTYDCLIENIVVTTKEGYPVCTRPGYDINTRVYVRKGSSGLIYESSDPDASNVDSSPISANPLMEVDC